MSVNEVLAYLSARAGGFSSGQAMADGLGVTRAAVWKAVKSLRADGYEIESVRARGYRLVSSPDRLGERELAGALGDGFWVSNVHALAETDSTNTVAMRLASDGAPEGTLVVAESQASGRGRLGRVWSSPPAGNIYASLVLRPGFPPSSAPLITLAASVALASAISDNCGIQARIKWPNDILVSGRKLAGILTEMSAEPDRIRHVVVGFGVNVNSGPADFPDDISAGATSVHIESGRTVRRAGLLASILGELERVYSMLKGPGRGDVLDEWRTLSDTLGRRVRVGIPDGTVTGKAVDIDSTGALIVRLADGSDTIITSGDVLHLR